MRKLTIFVLGTWAVAIALSAQTPPVIQKAPPNPKTSPTSGKQMFTEYCAVCHGKEGKGDGPAATALKKAPADLTTLSTRNGGKFPDIRVARYIEGQDEVAAHGSRDMPIWGTVFHSIGDTGATALRVSNLTDYVRSLQAK
jgi:mono/diheme cytochrome c family protein